MDVMLVFWIVYTTIQSTFCNSSLCIYFHVNYSFIIFIPISILTILQHWLLIIELFIVITIKLNKPFTHPGHDWPQTNKLWERIAHEA